MRRAVVAAVAATATATALLATPSRAQERSEPLGGARHRPPGSPQNFAAEIRVSRFTPDIDSDPALHGQTPYASSFGSDSRFLVSGELDWQAVRIPHFGSLGPGIGVGYTRMSANAQFAQPHVSPSGSTSTASGEDTDLEIFPFYAVAVLRADVLWRDLGIPLVPYGKLGLGYSLWRASNTLGTSSYGGVAGKGHALGTELALGLAFNLNVFDEYAAVNFDESMGVNNSYIFAEWTRADLTGFGQSNELRVGGTSWTFGLAFEF
jgi:hypothetical protein